MNALVTTIAVASIALGALSVLAIASSELARTDRRKRERAKKALNNALDRDSKESLPFPSDDAPLDVIAGDPELTELALKIVRERQ